MADVFMQFDAKALVKNKYILFLGDSNIRAQYKDLIWLLNNNSLIERKPLKSKLEPSYLGDKLTERSECFRGRDYRESRLYEDRINHTRLEFIFLTRCYNRRIQNLLNNIKMKTRMIPDVIVVNSCLWDLTRWGPNGVPEYKDNMVKLMRLMSQTLPKECLVIWCTALPTAPHVRGALIIKQIEFIEPMLRFEVMEANTFAREVVVSHGFDVLDNHYYTRMQMHRRAKDGVHYLPIPVRFMTNLILTHIALSWDRELPHNVQSVILDKAIAMENKPQVEPKIKIPTSGLFSKINLVSPVVPKARGLTITFSPQQCGRRQCSLFKDNLPMKPSLPSSLPLAAVGAGGGSRVRSVVTLPPSQPHCSQEQHTAAGPQRRRRNKKKRKANHPYQQPSYYDPHSFPGNTPTFYNPIPYCDPYNGGYYYFEGNNGNYYSDDE